MFIDEVTVKLKAGDGGRGCMSFRREAYEPRGGPNGGNGGKGGCVVLVGDENTSDLTDYKFAPNHRAKNGEPGRGSDQHGANGPDLRLRVPLGLEVIDTQTGETVTEILRHQQEVILLKGGRGGVGNSVFKSSTNQAPRQTTPGAAGEDGEYRLVLKTIADCGLVGYPNAGKSTLLSLLTNADPKIGHYPFTTLNPYVGVMNLKDRWDRVTVADIPGLIEGAAEGRGLGHRFLRHVERCRLLLFVLDMGGTDGRSPIDDYPSLLTELGSYQKSLLTKPRIIVANKMDELPQAETFLTGLKLKVQDYPIIPVSCLSEEGLEALRNCILAEVAKLPDDASKQG